MLWNKKCTEIESEREQMLVYRLLKGGPLEMVLMEQKGYKIKKIKVENYR